MGQEDDKYLFCYYVYTSANIESGSRQPEAVNCRAGRALVSI